MTPDGILHVLGCASIVVVVGFTWHAYTGDSGLGQSRRQSIIEAWVNIAIGLVVNLTANMFLLPLVGAKLTLAGNLWLGCTFTAVSIVRQYAIRRWFNNAIHTFAARAAGRTL